MDEAIKFKIRKIVEELKQHKGAHTELVSVYIPAGYELSKITQNLAQEKGTATNIKSAGTRKNVIDALEKMIQHLKGYNRNPANGLCVFSGNIASMEGRSDVKVWSIEPPLPMQQKLYRCDKTFITEPLEDMAAEDEIYALIVMDKRECTMGILQGKTIIPILQTTSWVPGKFRTGGQSAARFQRIRQNAASEFYSKIAQHMTESLLPRLQELKGIIIGGPGPTKYELVESGYILENIKAKIIGIKDITYTDEFGLHELLEKSDDILATASVSDERRIMTKFFTMLNKEQDKVTYGKDEVKKYLEASVVDTVLISESVDTKTIEEFSELAQKFGSELKIISTGTREGAQLKDIGGFVAILRYSVSL